MTIAMFGAAAGSYTAELETSVEASGVAAVANSIMGLQQPLLGIDLSDDGVWTDFVLGNLGINDTNAAYGTAAAYFAARFEAGATRGDIIAEAVAYLLDTVSAEFTAVAAAFVTQVEAAEEWSVGDGAAVFDIDVLRVEGADNSADPAVFNLTAALATLTAAGDAADAYLVDEAAADEAVAAEIDDAGGDAEDPADVRVAIDNVEAAAIADVDLLATNAGAPANFDSANAAGQTAIIAAARALLAAELTADEAVLAAAQADVDAIDGLQEAITAYEAALAAEEAAFEADDIAAGNLVGEIGDIEARNPSFTVVADETVVTDVTIQIGSGAIVPVFEYNAVDEVWELTTAATEATYPGITDLFNVFVAAFDAHAAGVAADTAEDDAFADMDEADGVIDTTTLEYDTLVAAQDALDDGTVGSEVDVADFEEAVAAFEAITAIVDQLAVLDGDVTDAEGALTDNDYFLETLANSDALLADADNNVYSTAELVATDVASITAFGDAGSDILNFGGTYSLVALGDDDITDNVGDVTALEIFWEEDAGNLVLYVEAETFAGSMADDSELITITLVGFEAADIGSFNGTFLTA